MIFPLLAAAKLTPRHGTRSNTLFRYWVSLKVPVTRAVCASAVVAFAKRAEPTSAKPARPKSALTKLAVKKTVQKKPVKTAQKKPVKAVVKKTVKKTVAAKPRVVKKKKKPIVVKKILVIKPEHKPPKKPTPPNALYIAQYLKDHPIRTDDGKGGQNAIGAFKDAAKSWTELSDDEKQPFIDQYRAKLEQFRADRVLYYENTPSAIINAINKKLKAKGKHRIREPKELTQRRSLPAFMRFMKDFQRTQEGEALLSGPLGNLGKAAGAKWRAMSNAEKQPYVDAYVTERAQL